MTMNRDPDAWRRLGRALKEARERKGLSQGELATRAGVAIKSVQSAEAGTVPKSRMPQSLSPIAQAVGWPAGSVDSVLSGGEPPGGWRTVQIELEDDQIRSIIANAMVRATSGATAEEIRNATKIAVDDLRRIGAIRETVATQPKELNGNS